jgi:LysR family glycine cleavage system transcriptional activator
VALARTPLVADSLANGDLVEPLARHPAELATWPTGWCAARVPTSAPRCCAFANWLLAQAAETRVAMGEAG